ncbi:Ig-like domain-containing protein [Nocardioides ochotonae]|uniref:Ig-like domain-containing protein n=1 Tax=Nocardioides ochotonae TaxID=2685869 RepID=UPI00140C9B4D|nr:Ig-like domain-containing protein [Nocardioides ochotonae]
MRHQSVRSVSRAAVGVLAAATMLPLMSATAHAETNTAPVAGDDAVTLYATGITHLDLLANDADADGDELAVCRVERSPVRRVLLAANGSVSSIGLADLLGLGEDDLDELGPLAEPGYALVATGPKASGTYRFTYYACDRTALAPATVTATVLPAPKVTVRKVAGKPGRLRVTNPSTLPMRFSWEPHNRSAELPWLGARGTSAARAYGAVRVPAGATRTVRVKGPVVSWDATGRRGGFHLEGRVRGIRTR